MTGPKTSTQITASIVSVMLIAIPLAITAQTDHPAYYSKLLWLHSGLVVLAALAFRGHARFPKTPLMLPAVAFLFINTFSIVQSVNRVTSLVTISHRLALLTSFILFIAVIDRISKVLSRS